MQGYKDLKSLEPMLQRQKATGKGSGRLIKLQAETGYFAALGDAQGDISTGHDVQAVDTGAELTDDSRTPKDSETE